MSDTKVYILDGGSLVIDGFHLFWNKGPAGEVRFPVYSILIDHADGLFLMDTGFDHDHVMRVLPFEKPQQTPEQTIPGALARIGRRPEDVDVVINSHYHFDHCGGNRHCVNAETVCHAREFEAAKAPQPFEHLGYSDLSFAPELAFKAAGDGPKDHLKGLESYHPRFRLIEGDQEIAKGVHLFETPGHTAGHYSLMVELASRRPLLFAIDVAYTVKSLETLTIASFHLDPVANIESMRRIRALAGQFDAELFFPHDAQHFQTYRKAPDFYA